MLYSSLLPMPQQLQSNIFVFTRIESTPRGGIKSMNQTPVTPPATPRQRSLLTDSPLTEEDRRQVRYMEREMLKNMKENAAELIELESDKFNLATLELDEMYEQVCYPRVGNLDGLCLDVLGTAVGNQANTLSGTDLDKVWISPQIKMLGQTTDMPRLL